MEEGIFMKAGKEGKRGPPPPTKSVVFIDNTGGGELARRFQEAEKEQGMATGYRVSWECIKYAAS